MMSDAKKTVVFILAAMLALLLLPLCAVAQSDWAVFAADPPAGKELKAGDTVAYTLVIQEEAEGEQMLRIQTPKGVSLSENGFVYRPSDGEGECSAIWGSDGCVLTAPRFAKGDMLMFVARVEQPEEAELTCSVTWNNSTLSLFHTFALPEPAITQPEPGTAPVPTAAPATETALSADDGMERRQTAALLINALTLPGACAGLGISIGAGGKRPKGKNAHDKKTEEKH